MIDFEKPEALFGDVLQNLIQFCDQSSHTGLQRIFEELYKDLHECQELNLKALLTNEEKLKQIKESQLQETILKRIFLNSRPKQQGTFKETEAKIYDIFEKEFQSVSEMIISQSQKLQACLKGFTVNQEDITKPSITIPYDEKYYKNCETEEARCDKLIKCFQSLYDMVQLNDSDSFDLSEDSTEFLKERASEELFLETFYLKIFELHISLYYSEHKLVTPRNAQKSIKTIEESTLKFLSQFKDSDSDFSEEDNQIMDSPALTPTFDIQSASKAVTLPKDNATKENYKNSCI